LLPGPDRQYHHNIPETGDIIGQQGIAATGTLTLCGSLAETFGQKNIQLLESFVVFRNADEFNGIALPKLNAYDRIDTVAGSETYEVEYAGGIVDIGKHQLTDAETTGFFQ
jgi:hypothetical protein